MQVSYLPSELSKAMALPFQCLQTMLLFIAILALLSPADSVQFQMLGITPEDPILYQGDAVNSVGTVEFNNVNYVCRVGWATYAGRMRLWEKDTGKVTDFTSHFSFSIDTRQLTSYGHGLVFFLAPEGSEIPPNSSGGFLGLFNTSSSYSAQNQIVAVEFDSFSNPEWDPPEMGGHVGINNNSIRSAVVTPWNASKHSGDTADVWITYNATTKNLSVSWSYLQTNIPGENRSLSYQIGLAEALPEWVMVGFSAATGFNVERHTLNSWEFNSTLNENDDSGMSSRSVKIIIGVAVPGVVLIAVAIIASLVLWRQNKRKKKLRQASQLASVNEDLEKGAGPKRFSYKELATATSSFSDDRKLGEGGFGSVYRGYLPDHDMIIAVKRISKRSTQGRKQYVTEVKIISQLRHRNLVQLIGWCHEKDEFLLVYEYMTNGSLDYHLFGNRSHLAWPTRYKISLGLASALLYLHEEWEQCVVHRDIKSSNIMLDSTFSVKLGDFGLARLMDHEIGPQTTGLAGTFGYMAPEYISTGKASKESDVYSFGVVALEIATGKKASGPPEENSQKGLVEWIWELYGIGELESAIDESLNQEFEEKQVERLMMVGLWCAHPDFHFRPSIRQALQVLHFDAPLPNLPARMPVPTYYVPTPSISSNEASITHSLAYGR